MKFSNKPTQMNSITLSQKFRGWPGIIKFGGGAIVLLVVPLTNLCRSFMGY